MKGRNASWKRTPGALRKPPVPCSTHAARARCSEHGFSRKIHDEMFHMAYELALICACPLHQVEYLRQSIRIDEEVSEKKFSSSTPSSVMCILFWCMPFPVAWPLVSSSWAWNGLVL